MRQVNPGSIYFGQFAVMLVITSANLSERDQDLSEEELVYFLRGEIAKMRLPALDERRLFQAE
jgi:hypothetical protein